MISVVLVTVAIAALNQVDGGEPPPQPDDGAQQVTVTGQADAGELAEPPEQANPDRWQGEHRRIHFGVGALVHGGLMDSGGYPLWMLQSELIGVMSIRVRAHDELRVRLGIAFGWPDSVGGEANVSFNHGLSPRLSIGIGGFAFVSLWSVRVGVEVPWVIRIGSSRRSNLIIALRLQSGVFNNVALAKWTLAQQRFAFAGEVVVGYAFLF